MFFKKKKNAMVEQIEKEAELMEYVMLQNQRKRTEEEQVLSNIQNKKREFQDKYEPLYLSKFNFMTVEEMQVLNFKCLDSTISYFCSLSKHLLDEELEIGKRTLGLMQSDLSKVMERIKNSINGEKIEESLVSIIEFLYVYEELQQSYLAVDFYSIKRVFPEMFFIVREKKEMNIA